MVAWELIHIAYALTFQLHHQAQDSRLTTIFLGPYITRLAWGLGLIDHCSNIWQVGGMQPLWVTTLQEMHMIESWDIPHGVQS